MNLKARILDASQIVGVSSFENAICEYLYKELTAMGIDSYVDENGNIFGQIACDAPGAKTLLLEAHIDQVGLIVSGIDQDGRIRFTTIGGVDERILCGMEVELQTNPPIYGVVGPVSSEKMEKTHKIEELRIDIGYPYEKVKDMVCVGDSVVFCNTPQFLLGDKISAAAMDNRAGIAAVLDCLQKVREKSLPFCLRVLFSVGEELGLQGAYTAAMPGVADAAIVIDVTHGMTPDAKDNTGVFPLGSGAIICRGPSLHDGYAKQLISLAKEKSIPYDIEVASGSSGTTAWAIQTAGGGIPVALVSIPIRYMHSNLETLSLADVQAVSDLLNAALTGGISIVE